MKNFADRTVDVAFSPVRKVLEQAEQMQEKGERVIHLEIGEPDFHTPSHIVEATQKALTNGYTHYFPNRGYLPLRQAIKERLLQTGKVLYNPDSEIILTAGAAEGILDAIAGYYGQWQATNRDTSLVGINKLEIGEIRTGEEGYYVLCRLTFAGTDGDEVVKYVTAYVKISQNSMLLNQIEEEKL